MLVLPKVKQLQIVLAMYLLPVPKTEEKKNTFLADFSPQILYYLQTNKLTDLLLILQPLSVTVFKKILNLTLCMRLSWLYLYFRGVLWYQEVDNREGESNLATCMSYLNI
jgi:hypothetical protein